MINLEQGFHPLIRGGLLFRPRVVRAYRGETLRYSPESQRLTTRISYVSTAAAGEWRTLLKKQERLCLP
jgi:hypothetical protein